MMSLRGGGDGFGGVCILPSFILFLLYTIHDLNFLRRWRMGRFVNSKRNKRQHGVG